MLEDDRLTKARMYRKHAAEARARAAAMSSGQAANELLDIASDWEFLAARIERRVKENPRESFAVKPGTPE